MISNRSVPNDTLLPHVTYRDLERALLWLSNAFGFVELHRYGKPIENFVESLVDSKAFRRNTRQETETPQVALDK